MPLQHYQSKFAMSENMSSSATGAESPDSPVETVSDQLRILQVRYDGLVAREKRYKKSIEELQKQQVRDRRSLEQLRASLAATSGELEAVRRSWRFRVGSVLIAPASVLRGLLRRATGSTVAAPASLPAGKGAGVRASSTVPRKSYEELERLAATAPTIENAYAFARAAYFERGHVQMARQAMAGLAADRLSAPQRRLVTMLDGLHRLMTVGPAIPPRQPNSNLVVNPDRVLYCVHSAMPYLTNGYSTRTHGVAAGSRRAGVDMVVATRPGFPWDAKGAAGAARAQGRLCVSQSGVPYVFTPGPDLETLPLDHYIAAAADAFAREALRQRASVIHAASNHVTGLAALIAARRLGLPFVYEVRGLWEVTQASDRQGWESTDRYQLAVRLEGVVVREADRVLAITSELKDELVARGVEGDRIDLLPNCVDIDEFAPVERDLALVADLGLDAGVPTIGFAGSVVAYEGLDLLVEALGVVHAQGIGFNLLIVGDGAALPALKKAVQAAGIESRTRFTGRVPRARVRGLMSCMDIMPCPRRGSVVTEMVSPLKPLEAMAMAKAVLLSDVSPHLEFAGAEQDRAMLFRKDDVQDLVRALGELIEHPGLRERLGRAGRRWVVKHRTWDVAGRTLLQAYAEAARQSAALVAAEEADHPAAQLAALRLGLIADRFTTDSLGPDIAVVRPTPDGWRELLEHQPIDALLVESAWEGNDGSWTRRVGYYSDEEIAPLRDLVEHCRSQGIPTMFWNKEDPVHFSRFERTAALFDHVFTTDSDCIVRYLATPGTHARTASALPFFAQPRIHNPLPSSRPWSHDVCYAGSYYGERYAERSRQLDELLLPAAQLGLTIYDRQHFRADSPYHFPDRLSPFVKGGLDYADVVQAYKSHAVHLNVNSVEKSPTMFSRRVMEIAASGTALLSSAGRGVEETMAGTVRTVSNAEEAARWLSEWLQDEAARHDAILPPLREVLRAHTAAHRLVQALRTAGLRVRAPELARYALVCDRLDDETWAAVRRQTFPPALVVARSIDTGRPAREDAVLLDGADLKALLAERNCQWLGLLTPEHAVEDDEHFYEDLLLSTCWNQRDGMGMCWLPRAVERGAHVPLVEVGKEISPADGLVRVEVVTAPGLKGEAAIQVLSRLRLQAVVMNRFRPAELTGVTAKPAPATILVAGHDLKFLRAVMEHWERQGHRVLIDSWSGHNQHDPVRSAELLEQADLVFCEWCLGNAVWYASHKRPGQRLVVRFHAQELRSPLAAGVSHAAVDQFIFVGRHILEAAVQRYQWPAERCTVVPNYVSDDLRGPLPSGMPLPVVGLVGITPRMKRLDLALDLVAQLRQCDPRFRLLIKGRRPEEYGWMRNRPEEMAFFEAQYRRAAEDPQLAGAVDFEPFGDDMAAFYRRIGYVISVSDHESFHLSLPDGAASGAIPTTLDWLGADRIYPADWIVGSIQAMAQRILAQSTASEEEVAAYRACNAAYVESRFAECVVLSQIDACCALDARQEQASSMLPGHAANIAGPLAQPDRVVS
ncbi:glycosyltransferase [Ideonella sp. YS5]|uniref:glycosyltransferase n=1 Tax=Ideonella sp. YS5 TaxID=3453714 RepID=UPI003EEC39D2